jgi:hypothetical protein
MEVVCRLARETDILLPPNFSAEFFPIPRYEIINKTEELLKGAAGRAMSS